MEGPVIAPNQAILQGRILGFDSAELCDDVENVIGDILCDALDELESVLSAEPTVSIDRESVREGVDKAMYQFQKHAVNNCRVFKRYSLQQVFNVTTQVAERICDPMAGAAPTAAASASAIASADEEKALDAELARYREQAHLVRLTSSSCARRAVLLRAEISVLSARVLVRPCAQSVLEMDALRREEGALSRQVTQCTERLEWLSSLPSAGALIPQMHHFD
jgi:hypothetical protein